MRATIPHSLSAAVLAAGIATSAACLDRYGHPPNDASSADPVDAVSADIPRPDGREATGDTGRTCPEVATAAPCRSADCTAPGGCRSVVQFGSDGEDRATAVAVGSETSPIYVAGSTQGDLFGQTGSGGADAFVAAFDRTGARQWVRLFGTPADDRASDLILDGSSVLVVGTTTGDLDGQTNAGGRDLFATGFSADGRRQSTHLIGGPGDESWPGGSALARRGGRTYAVGTTERGLPGAETDRSGAFLAELGRRGTPVQIRVVGRRGTTRSAAVDAAPSDGRIAWTGTARETLAGRDNRGRDRFVAIYSSDLDRSWLALSQEAGPDRSADVAWVDGGGQIALAGTAGPAVSERTRLQVARYAADGSRTDLTEPAGGTGTTPTGGFAARPRRDTASLAGRRDESGGGARAVVADLTSQGLDARRTLDSEGNDVLLDAAGVDGASWFVGWTDGALEPDASRGDRDALLFRPAPDGER